VDGIHEHLCKRHQLHHPSGSVLIVYREAWLPCEKGNELRKEFTMEADLEPRDPEYGVVRVADEVVVDLMGAACGIDFQTAQDRVVWKEFEGVRIPFATPELLLETKQTVREKDAIDRLYLKRILSESDS
jgi:hypothetical protein